MSAMCVRELARARTDVGAPVDRQCVHVRRFGHKIHCKTSRHQFAIREHYRVILSGFALRLSGVCASREYMNAVCV